jgi:hypothetical protein
VYSRLFRIPAAGTTVHKAKVTPLMALVKKDARKIEKLAQALAGLKK